MSDGNRYLTPFEDIIPIKFAAWAQKSRMKSLDLMRIFLHDLDEPILALDSKECQGKKRYVSNTDAGMAIGRRKKDLQRTGDTTSLIGLHPYKCTQCNGWHIGHKPGSSSIIRKVRAERRSLS